METNLMGSAVFATGRYDVAQNNKNASADVQNGGLHNGLKIKTVSLGKRVMDFFRSLCCSPARSRFTPPTPHGMYRKLYVLKQEANLTARTLHLKNPLLTAPSPAVFALFDHASQGSFDELYCLLLERQTPMTGLRNQKHFFEASVAGAAMALDLLRESGADPADIFWLKLTAATENNFLREAICEMDGGRWTARLAPVKHLPGRPKLSPPPNPMWTSKFIAPSPVIEAIERPRGYY